MQSLVPVIVTIVVVMGAILGACAYLIYIERKIAAYVQDRIGPNRVGPFGLLQPIADGLKFLLKEEIVPTHVDKLLYLAAPAIAVTTALLAFAVVPFGPTTAPKPGEAFAPGPDWVIAPRIDIGIVLLFAITSLTVYAIILGGWASNNKYSFLGALRSSAQLISYEIPMGLSILGVVLMAGSLNLERVIDAQSGIRWFIWYQPVAFLVFMTSAFAECNRLPFDLPEAEQELVGGYHTEYSAMKFGMFFIGEYTHLITTSFLMAILFFGGWHFPGLTSAGAGGAVVKFLVLVAKVTFFILLYMLVRWTIPRFRFDQLMHLAWKGLIPLSLANLVAVAVVEEWGASRWWLLLFSVLMLLVAGAAVARPARRPPIPVRAPALAESTAVTG